MNETHAIEEGAAAGRTGGRLRRWAGSFVAAVVVLALAAVTALAGYLVWDDFQREDTVPLGVSVEGLDIGGLSPADAVVLVDEEFGVPLRQHSLTAYAETSTYQLDAADVVSVDASGVVSDAYALRNSTSLLDRVAWRVTQTGMGVDLPVRLDYDAAYVSGWVAGIAAQVDQAAVDASRAVDVYAGVFSVIEAKEGRRLDQHAATLDVRDALLYGFDEVALPVEVLQPANGGADLGLTIHVDISERRLRLYDGATVVKEYGVAVGTPGHPTPRGEWKIIQKRYMPGWSNPGSAWAANMPAYIPPGPSNPLGTRALNIDASGIRIHGTTADYSIGSAASHGCMRMHRWDIEDLYDRVEVGTPVIITS